MKSQRIRGRYLLGLVGLSVLSLALSGCEMTVESRVRSNGTIHQTISTEVLTEDYDLIRHEAERYLPEGWRFQSKEKLAKRQLICTRKFSAYDPDAIKTITFKRDVGWLIPVDHYTYKEEITYHDMLTTDEKRMLAGKTKVRYMVTLPGSIDADHTPNAVKVQGGTAMWESALDKEMRISATSTALRWVWGFLELVILAGLVWAAMPAINWCNETYARMQEKRKTARVEKAHKLEEKALLKAQQQAAKDAAKQQQEAERQRKIEDKLRQESDRERARLEKERQKQEAQLAREEERRKKEEAKRQNKP